MGRFNVNNIRIHVTTCPRRDSKQSAWVSRRLSKTRCTFETELKSKKEVLKHLFYKKGKTFKLLDREVTSLVRGYEYSVQKQS